MSEDILDFCLSFIDADICEEFFVGVELKTCDLAESDHESSSRIYAHTMHDNDDICVCQKFFELPKSNRAAIIFHELGHIMDEKMGESSDMHRELSDHEIRADMIAQVYFGMRIFYDKNKVQWVELE